MRDPSLALRKAYFEALDGMVYDVPVFNRPPNREKYPFILLSNQTAVDISDKTSYCWECTILVDIVTGFDGDFGGGMQADEIGEEVIGIIRTRAEGYLDLGAELQVVTTTIDDVSSIDSQSQTHYIYRKLIRFRHIINQLTEKVHE